MEERHEIHISEQILISPIFLRKTLELKFKRHSN